MNTENENKPDKYQVDFIRMQFEKAIDTYQKQSALFVQITTVLVVANVTLLGFAFTNKSAGVFLAGALFPPMVLYLMSRFRKIILPYLYVAVSIEQKYGGSETDWMASTYLATNVSLESLQVFKKISNENNYEIKIERLKKNSIPLLGRGKGLSRATLIMAFLGQVTAPFILAYFFNWQLF